MNLSIHTAPHQCLPIFEFTVASQQPEFVEFHHVQLAVFQLIKIFADDYQVSCVNEFVHISCNQCQIGIVVLAAASFWREVVDFHFTQQQRLLQTAHFPR